MIAPAGTPDRVIDNDSGLAESLATSARAGARWLVARIGSDGKPFGADERNSWWRTPWSLALVGEREAAAAVLSWVEREALDADADLRVGPARGDLPMSPAYQLAHLAIGASLLNRYDLAERLLGRLRSFQHPKGGGIRLLRAVDDVGEQDFLLTTQWGLASLIGGHLDEAATVYTWLDRVWAAQKEVAQGRLYTMWSWSGLVTEFAEDAAFMRRVDFNRPLQAFYQPGAAAAFLADYGLRTDQRGPIDLARQFLQMNIAGNDDHQFNDLNSVQICKFGWGAGQMLTADPEGGWLPHVERSARWFIDRQADDGSWAASAFTLKWPPTDNDRMWKTAEHVMETILMSTALAAHYAATATSCADSIAGGDK